jgi:L-arabinokinase
MRAVVAAYAASTGGLRLAALCQIVENRVVSAPCGIMDQVTCALGQAGKLLALRCQPHDVLGWHTVPAGLTFVGLDSGVKHAVGGKRYPLVRCAAFMGRAMIQDELQRGGEDPARAGYLCNLSPAEYRARFRDLLPVRLSGAEFLRRWGETGDTATTVDPDAIYRVRGATEHPIYENARVQRFIRLLERGDAPAAGRLMYGSHRSYTRNCGLGSPETDLLVSLVRAEGPSNGLYGGKITGGGSGGTVAVLAKARRDGTLAPEAAAAISRVSAAYQERIGRPPRSIAGSRPGAEQIEPARFPWPDQ